MQFVQIIRLLWWNNWENGEIAIKHAYTTDIVWFVKPTDKQTISLAKWFCRDILPALQENVGTRIESQQNWESGAGGDWGKAQ